ncbi:hypothetical protein SBA1_580011 [Candidatus Sulfotelmatobacter kueseliae]|uniref:Uncharacterized protein n=1 Tax=Candidatus Sulfotelmatobacter kueseliae TaxID=2042962 RepID=A0A2U3L077_9BACT|nr:hypothetical protein SBA1_580011 [Candidatus Sulfotelmatobacter kueseliae]
MYSSSAAFSAAFRSGLLQTSLWIRRRICLLRSKRLCSRTSAVLYPAANPAAKQMTVASTVPIIFISAPLIYGLNPNVPVSPVPVLVFGGLHGSFKLASIKQQSRMMSTFIAVNPDCSR